MLDKKSGVYRNIFGGPYCLLWKQLEEPTILPQSRYVWLRGQTQDKIRRLTIWVNSAAHENCQTVIKGNDHNEDPTNDSELPVVP